MSTLPVTKQEETQAIATVWNMGLHSLDPHRYEALEEALKQLCANRNINEECLQGCQIHLSGKQTHASDCETSSAPAFMPGPCNCDFQI